jgi:hypothetical protein
VGGGKEDERAGRRTTTATREMGGHAGRGGGGSPVALDLLSGRWEVTPARTVVDPAPELSRMEDDGHEAWPEVRKTSTVELGTEDERGG